MKNILKRVTILTIIIIFIVFIYSSLQNHKIYIINMPNVVGMKYKYYPSNKLKIICHIDQCILRFNTATLSDNLCYIDYLSEYLYTCIQSTRFKSIVYMLFTIWITYLIVIFNLFVNV